MYDRGAVRKHLGEIFHELDRYREWQIGEGHLRQDHVHVCVGVPPNYALSNVIGCLKGKCAISKARNFARKRGDFTGENFSARAYQVSRIWWDEDSARKYVWNRSISTAEALPSGAHEPATYGC